MSAESSQQHPASRFFLGASLVLIAFNLRALFSSASALLPEIRSELQLSPLVAGLLTTLPVVCLGLFAPLAPRLARRMGAEKTMFCVLVLLALGTGLRGLAPVGYLFLGTALAGACIAIGNVLLPGMVKRDFPRQGALMTGLYTMALCAGAASAAGLTLPIEKALGGSLHGALAAWALPAVAVAVIWLPQVVHGARRAPQDRVHVAGLWRDRLAWNVTLFMGFQSALAYSVFGWLVPILRERGLDAVVAGSIVSMSVMIQAMACLAVPHIAVRGKNQSLINLALCTIAVTALVGLLFAPLSTVWLWAALQGIGQGGLIAAAMTVIVLRSRDPHVAAQLSSMAQCVGYLLAAAGPLIVGVIRGWTGSFAWCALLFIVLGAIAGINGWRAGRASFVNATSGPAATGGSLL
jgi:CP family cyanate transporter-like MFS transporter